ncbi:MAG TPA: PLP-dependent aminotransferase family protein [Beijerinckiaceae bacterium]|nr:PLP-dependent aminotransferase family protein [Beijerinckiaceae bacterium]
MPSRAAAADTFRLAETGESLHERIADAIESAIAEGRYGPGERLPPHRALARGFDVAIGTVTRAVDLLAQRGLVRGEVGRGTFVLNVHPSSSPGEIVDLSTSAPPRLLEPDVIAAAAARAARAALDLPTGGYADVTGPRASREALADWLTRTRLPADADDLVVCVGAQHALTLAFADVAERTAAIAAEPATFPGAIAAARALGLTLVPVPVDEHGMVPDALDAALREKGVGALYTMPTAHNPLGFDTPPERLRALLDVCARHQAPIVEDDVHAHFGGAGSLAYKALAPDLVYYVNGLSKALSPALRIGVLVPPAHRRPAIAERVRAELWAAPPIAVLTATELLRDGADRRALAGLREEASIRARIAASELNLPGLADRPAPHVWIGMPLTKAEWVARRALESGVRITPPATPILDPSLASGIRLCIQAPPERRALMRALRVVGRLLQEPEGFVV